MTRLPDFTLASVTERQKGVDDRPVPSPTWPEYQAMKVVFEHFYVLVLGGDGEARKPTELIAEILDKTIGPKENEISRLELTRKDLEANLQTALEEGKAARNEAEYLRIERDQYIAKVEALTPDVESMKSDLFLLRYRIDAAAPLLARAVDALVAEEDQP